MPVQFSRGCPFNCEFCDIVAMYGRVPRTKTPAQMIAELDAVVEGLFKLFEVPALELGLAKQFLDPNDIRNNPDQGGGALYDLGSYTISACSAAFGRAPKRVIAAIDRDPAWKIDRLSTALLDYGDGHASFTVGSQSGPSAWATHQQFSVLGSNGWLRCDFPYAHGRPAACHVFVGDHTSHGTFETTTHSFEPVNQYTLQVERFSRYLRGEAVASWPIEDSLLTLRVIEALFESARSGRWQSVAG
jgi:predicted dehydrogenase